MSDFSRVGETKEESSITATQYASCGCPERAKIPRRAPEAFTLTTVRRWNNWF